MLAAGRGWTCHAHKDEAKAAGARWDPQAQRWFAPRADMPQMDRWTPLPELLPGEDRQFGSGLFVDLIPASCWFTNVRSCIAPNDWDRVRRTVYARARQRCEACGGERDREAQIWLEAHERWEYDENRTVQKLRRLVCLCTRCHEATHYGRATVYGYDDRARAQLMKVNRWPDRVADRHIEESFAEWDRRNRFDWTLDLSMLTVAGIALADPPQAKQRLVIATATLSGGSSDTTVCEVGAPGPTEMAETAEPVPRPGWFRDPAGRYEYRWWTGEAWTADVATGGVSSLDPL
jgi:hypothetical protein